MNSLVAWPDWWRDWPESPTQVGSETILRAKEAVEDGDAPPRALEDFAFVVSLAMIDAVWRKRSVRVLDM